MDPTIPEKPESSPSPQSPRGGDHDSGTLQGEPKIYLLPNLMTAGNLFCGFAAVLQIFEGMMLESPSPKPYYTAIGLILLACVFDLLDGRLARLGGKESPFGREFDSLADVVSFGMAPALLVFNIVLKDFPERLGWLIAFAYLLCGAMRLARFNCIAAANPHGGSKDFVGFPIPAAAGVISSLTLFLLWIEGGHKQIGNWKYALPILMLLLSYLMFSKIHYPSFKKLGWRTKASLPVVFTVAILMVFTVWNWQFMPAVLFVGYMLYGFVRPWIGKRWRRSIEQYEDKSDHHSPPGSP